MKTISLKPAYLDALKELGRVGLLAVIPLLIQMLDSGKIEWKTLLVVGLIASLKAIDKLLHEVGKISDDKNLVLGITRF